MRPMLWLALLLALPCGGQAPMRSPNSPTFGGDQTYTGDAGDQVYQERRLRQLYEAQHKSMVSDTDRLLKLVTELNAEIDSTNPSALTPDQLRKVAEIEKLAHSVRDKMRMSVRAAPANIDANPLPPLSSH
jgi:hypothetical protein